MQTIAKTQILDYVEKEIQQRKADQLKVIRETGQRSDEIDRRILILQNILELVKSAIETPRGDQTNLFKQKP
jgi:hypothetical protein